MSGMEFSPIIRERFPKRAIRQQQQRREKFRKTRTRDQDMG